ncbi:hypothetical protein NJB93_21000 [Brucella intermedia]|uniref:hypothetical protein n=1 Tax=Brucella intermedia TaxID=94625 RepID=UPI00209AB17F|nr:hypothetical protein [Brucella intermedia]MCO7729038.1 hypothetical protein [Brucella intermedia]
MTHELRNGAPTVMFYEKPKAITVPWVVDYQGVPSNINVPLGTGVYYSPEAQILHLRNDLSGRSRTYTPEVFVTIDHGEPNFELEFCDPDNRRRFMPSVAIGEHYISFRADNSQEGYKFSNRAMFETFCDFMASPLYNPFTKPIPPTTSWICADVQKRTLFYKPYAHADGDTPDPYLNRAHEYPIDEARCDVISFRFENDRPLPVWDRHDREDVLLTTGVHEGRIASWSRETGDPEKIYVKGDNTNDGWIAEGHVEWPAFVNEMKLGFIRWGDLVERAPFDPSRYKPRVYQELTNLPTPQQRPAKKVAPARAAPSDATAAMGGLWGAVRKFLGR